MAGFQQAANSLTSAYGTVVGRVGVYNELVGKNQELIKKIQAQKEELTEKNAELQDFYDKVKQREEYELQRDKEAEEEYIKQAIERQKKREANKELKKVIERRATIIDREWEKSASHMSKNMMINALYGDFASGSGGGI